MHTQTDKRIDKKNGRTDGQTLPSALFPASHISIVIFTKAMSRSKTSNALKTYKPPVPFRLLLLLSINILIKWLNIYRAKYYVSPIFNIMQLG